MLVKTPKRLLAAMRWIAILSQSEAEVGLRDYRAGREYSGEAVNHFGGTKEVVRSAVRARHMAARELRFIRSMERAYDAVGARTPLEGYNLTYGAL